MTTKEIRIGFVDFWPGFCPKDFFVPFVTSAMDCRVAITDPALADIVFTSVFPKRTISRRVVRRVQQNMGIKESAPWKSKNSNQKKIWFTGENLRPPVDGFDLAYSFDTDSYGGENIYLPLLYLSLDWFEDGGIELGLEGRRAGKVVTPSFAAAKRQSAVADRIGFACAFIGNPEPTRLRALAALQRIGHVDVFGKAFGQPVPNKFDIAQNYRFMLCFENDLFPGYVTEKPLEAWVAGCIPLWRGIDQLGILNADAHLNAYNFQTLDLFVAEVALLNSDSERLNRMGSQPLFSNQLSLHSSKTALRNLFEQ
jgi:hypothetical protein